MPPKGCRAPEEAHAPAGVTRGGLAAAPAPDGTVARKLVSTADWTSPQMKPYLTGLTRQN